MSKLYETLTPDRRLEVAVWSTRPAGLARTFTAYAGQFYNRSAFDALARRVNDLYAARSPADATAFRTRLDRRLHDRYHDPVVWEAVSPAACRSTGLR